MKIRLGFVTNSSSSSFIISYKSFGGSVSPDDILRVIQMDLSEIEEEIIKLDEKAKTYGYNDFIKNYILSDNDEIYCMDIANECADDCGTNLDNLIECYRFIHKNHWILEAEGYKDYERLRKDKCESTYDYEDGWPFIIIDHTNTENSSTDEALEFYNEVCKTSANRVSDLGEIGVYSRDCWLPTYIVDTLQSISVYNCNHMG